MDDNRTFVMLKPDAVERGLVFSVTEYFRKYGFTIEAMDIVVPDEDMVHTHYIDVIAEHGPLFETRLKEYMVGRQVIPMVLYRADGNAVETARRMIGATEPVSADKGTVRGDLGTDSYEQCDRENRACHNLIHASDSAGSVLREISIWLPRYGAQN